MNKLIELTVNEYIVQAASEAPTPGGGSVAALAAALGSAMASMSANFTIGKKKYADFAEDCKKILEKAEKCRQLMLFAVDEDAVVFAKISEAYKLAKDSEDEKKTRQTAITLALKEAMSVPEKLLFVIADLAKELPVLAEKGYINLVSDTGVAACLLDAAARAAGLNVAINAKQLPDEIGKPALEKSRELLLEIKEICHNSLEIVERRILE